MAKKVARKSKKKLSKKYASFSGRMVMIGFGSIGQGVLPLIFRHIDIKPEQITVISAEDRGGLKELKKFGITFIRKRLTRENLRQTLDKRLGKGDFVVNLSVEVASTALVELCQEKGALYIDTCIEPWPGGYTDPSLSVSLRSNYALRENMLKLAPKYRGGPTAVIAHGANPGLVSHFVKKALVNLAKDTGMGAVKPTTREGWGELARDLGVKVIHIAERDTQVSRKPKKVGEFVNTWSIDGFVSEGSQPAEMGWGTHEKGLPFDGAQHEFGCDAAIYLNRPGLITRVRTWTPIEGPFHGFIITHNESISIADYFSLRQGQHVVYRPTVHYAYHPCDQAIMSMHECAGKNLHQQKKQRLIVDEITDGRDELGVLLMGHRRAPTGTARSSTSTRRASSRPTTTRPRSRSARPSCRASSGRWRTPTAASSRPTRWTSIATSRSACPISVRWSASTATGRRSRTATDCSPRTSTRPIPGSSGTSG